MNNESGISAQRVQANVPFDITTGTRHEFVFVEPGDPDFVDAQQSLSQAQKVEKPPLSAPQGSASASAVAGVSGTPGTGTTVRGGSTGGAYDPAYVQGQGGVSGEPGLAAGRPQCAPGPGIYDPEHVEGKGGAGPQGGDGTSPASKQVVDTPAVGDVRFVPGSLKVSGGLAFAPESLEVTGGFGFTPDSLEVSSGLGFVPDSLEVSTGQDSEPKQAGIAKAGAAAAAA